MTTVVINNNSVQARHFLRYVSTLPFATIQKETPKSELYNGLNSAFAEVRLMLDGKKKGKTAQEFLEEIRKEKANEVQGSLLVTY